MVEQDFRGEVDGEDSEGFDLEKLRELLSFVAKAVRRRAKTTAFVFVSVATLGLTVAAIMPRMYSAQVKLLAQRSSAIHLLSSPIPGMDSVDNPTKNVASMITRRDNLVALAKEVGLLERVEQTRSRILKFKDRLSEKIHGPPSQEDRELGLVQTLEKRLDVTTDEPTSTVTIAVDWPNPQLAYDLVTRVAKNFLEARYDSEVALITDSISVLEDHAKSELDHVDTELDAYQKVMTDHLAKAEKAEKAEEEARASARVLHAAPDLRPTVLLSPALAQNEPSKAKALEETRVRLRALEDAQERTVEPLKQQLVQAQLTLTPMHPTVIALQQQVDAMSQPTSEIVELRNRERTLMEELAAPSIQTIVSAARPALGPAAQPDASASDTAAEAELLPAMDGQDGPLQLAQSRLGTAIRAYEDTVGRIDAAKIELDVTRAAYKHKYTVVTPAELPRAPKKATTQLIAVGAVIAATILSVMLAVVLETIAGIVLQPWQVRRKLKLDVLGELDNPS